jgi:hypothetical protein
VFGARSGSAKSFPTMVHLQTTAWVRPGYDVGYFHFCFYVLFAFPILKIALKRRRKRSIMAAVYS